MKKSIFTLLALSALAFLAYSCEKETDVAPAGDNTPQILLDSSIPEVLEAEINPQDILTRTQYTDDFNSFGWSYNDNVRMPVMKKSGGVVTNCNSMSFRTEDANGTGDATFILVGGSDDLNDYEPTEPWMSMGYVIYPVARFNNDHVDETPVVKLPETYAQQLAKPLDGSLTLIGRKVGEKYRFSTAVGILKITLDNAPAGNTTLRLVSSDKPVSGKFLISDVNAEVSQLSNTDATDPLYQVSIAVTGLTAGASYSFYFQLPVGTYDARTLKLQVIQKDASAMYQEKVLLEQTIGKELQVKRNVITELPHVMYHRVWVQHLTPSRPYVYTEKPAAAHSVCLHIADTRLTAASYDHTLWKEGNRLSDEQGTFDLSSLPDNFGGYYLKDKGSYYLQYIVSADGSVPDELSDASVLAFGSVPFSFYDPADNVALTAGMLNVPYVSETEGAAANLVDGNISSFWASPHGSEDPARNATYGQIISIDLGESNTLASFDLFFHTRPEVFTDHPKVVDVYVSNKRWDEPGAVLSFAGQSFDVLQYLRPFGNACYGEWLKPITCAPADSYRYITISITGNYNGKDLRTTGYTHMSEIALYRNGTATPISVMPAVDLGLSVYWGAYNIDATAVEQEGGYYAWGEVTSKPTYNWSTYLWGSGDHALTKYNCDYHYGTVDNKVVLEPGDDVASFKLGGKWRMPTMDEWMELVYETDYEYTTVNGVRGERFISKTNGNSIFVPISGWYDEEGFHVSEYRGWYWSSTLDWEINEEPSGAWRFWFDTRDSHNSAFCTGTSRYEGFQVRPVLDK